MKNKLLATLSVLILILSSLSCAQLTDSALKFDPDALPSAQADTPYEAEISVSQNNTPVGAFSISKGALPVGLQLVKVEGQDRVKISGIPQESGTFTFTVSVWCYGTNVSGQTGEKEYTIVIP